MINGIGNQLSFRATSSTDLNTVFQPRKTSATTSNGAQTPAEGEAPKKSGHPILKTAAGLLAAAGLAYAAKTGILGTKVQEFVKPALEATTAKLGEFKIYLGNIFKNKEVAETAVETAAK